MGWSDIPPKKCVTFTDMLGSGVSLNSQQTGINSNRDITKSELITKYDVISSYLISLANNQLVKKELIFPNPVVSTCKYYNITIGATDLLDATGNSDPFYNGRVFLDYTDCNGIQQRVSYDSAGTYLNNLCSTSTYGFTFSYYSSNNGQIAINSSATQQGDCVPLTPTPTPNPTPTPTNPTPVDCTCWFMTYDSFISTSLEVRYNDCTTSTVVTQLVNTLLTKNNLDGTYTGFICVSNTGLYSTPICVESNFEVPCDYPWVSGGSCQTSGDCIMELTPTNTPTNTPTPTSTPNYTLLTYSTSPRSEPCFSATSGISIRWLCPMNVISSNTTPGVQNLPRNLRGDGRIYDTRLYIPTTTVSNLTVTVKSDSYKTQIPNAYNEVDAVLYYRIAPSTATTNLSITAFPEYQFPGSPFISSNSGGNVPILNSTYSVTIPSIALGQTLYVYWKVYLFNYNYDIPAFYYKGMNIRLSF